MVPLGRRLAVYDLSLEHDPRAAQAFVQLAGQTVQLGGAALHLWDAAHRDGHGAEDLARQWGLTDADVDAGRSELRALGAVSELTDTVDGRRTWAGAHTLHPLVLGLGEVADQPAAHHVGLPGRPVVQTTRAVRDVWAWGPLFGDLWTSVGWHAAGYAADGLPDPRAVDPDLLLADVVAVLPALLQTTAAYVDLALPAAGAA
ncbi:hypothetical protein SAMN03159343_1665 [Klenkia marina]|uniref:Uncharacterized protein n=1 Tax=Klenkia marina TaxID=1960309 RepID=A0A1G4XX42_9ACTN|nr:hypothetical protein SAMN03159343_1665 [Klenkia marina]